MQADGRAPDLKWLLFSPSGRAGRQVYVLSWLFWLCAGGFSATKLVAAQHDDAQLAIWFAVFLATAITSTVSLVMLSIKRLHDIGFPGPLALTLFIPAISFIALLALCLWPSDPQPNTYGPRSNWPRD